MQKRLLHHLLLLLALIFGPGAAAWAAHTPAIASPSAEASTTESLHLTYHQPFEQVGVVYVIYDFENRLIRRTVGGRIIDLYYDSEGQRVAKTVAGLETAYLLDVQNPTGYAQCVEELKQIGGQLSVVHRAYFGLQLFAEEEVSWDGSTSSSVLRFAHQDGHGSTRALSDLNGSISGEFTYDAFGILRESSGIFDLHHRYCSEFYDADLGMYYLRARWYQPELGRFWTMDTYEGRSEEPLTLHKYLYCGCDPVNMEDPSGNSWIISFFGAMSIRYGAFLAISMPGATLVVQGTVHFISRFHLFMTRVIAASSNVSLYAQRISEAYKQYGRTSTGNPHLHHFFPSYIQDALRAGGAKIPDAVSKMMTNVPDYYHKYLHKIIASEFPNNNPLKNHKTITAALDKLAEIYEKFPLR